MTILPLPAGAVDGSTTWGRYAGSICVEGVRMRAQCRHQATVVTISGDVDAVTSARVQAFAARFVRTGNALILDLSGVEFFSARGMSVLDAIDEVCRSAGVPFALVSSPIVSRVLRLTDYDTAMPITSSVPAALRQLAALTEARRRFALAITTAQRLRADRSDAADGTAGQSASSRSADAPQLSPSSTFARTSRPEPEVGMTVNVPLASAVAPAPPPVFSLGSALRWLGHDCPGHRCCRAPIDAMDASVWFIRREPGFVMFPHETHVLVDPGETGEALTSIHRLIYQVNRCTHGEAIVVRPRTRGDQTRTLTPRVAASRLLSEHATRLHDVAGPSEGDLRTIAEASRW
jgi:anti-anti-sigma factor